MISVLDFNLFFFFFPFRLRFRLSFQITYINYKFIKIELLLTVYF